jgi:tetratricopeptide (TPR) repeat protein
VVGSLPGIWGLALLATRWFVPAESAHLGETLWIVQLWLLSACVWSLFVLLRRSRPPRLDWADGAVWLLVAGHVQSALIVLSTEGQKRYALNMLWEWVGVGVSFTLLRHWLRGAAGLQQVVRTLTIGCVVLAGFGLWQYMVEFPAFRSQLQQLIRLEDRFDEPDSPLSAAEQSRLRELRRQLGSLATEQDPVARFKLRQRLLDSTEPLGRFALANTLGGLLGAGLILLPGAIFAPGRTSSHRRTALAVIAAGLAAYCFLLTKSRTAWAGWLVGVIAWGLMSFRKRIPLRRVLIFVAAASVMIAVLVLAAARNGGLDRLVITEAPKSLGYRFEYWSASARVIADHPLFGVGPGNFRQHYLRHKVAGSSEEVLDPHNQFLDVWASGGVMALVGLAWVWLRFPGRCRVADDGASIDGGIGDPHASRALAGARRLSAVGVIALLLLYLMQFIFEAIQDQQALALLAAWIVAAHILPDMEVPGPAILAAGLALGVHLLGAGGIAMPAICIPFLLLLLGTAREPGLPAAAYERPVTDDRPRSRWTFVVVSLALLSAAGACLMTGAWPSYYSRLLVAAGESAVYAAHDVERARRDFEAATRVDELDPDPWYDLASLDYSLVTGNLPAGDAVFDRAVRHLQEATRRDPFAPKLYWTAGQWQFARFRSTREPAALDQAIESMQRARDRYPNHAGIRSTLAEILAAASRPDAAQEARVALRLDDINHERGHIDVWLDPDTRARVQVIADQGQSTSPPDAETPP